jgi:putative transposase
LEFGFESQVTKDLATAYKNFFEKRVDFPQFKKKGRSSDRFPFPQGFEIDEANRRIRLPKLGWIRYRKSRGILGRAKDITVSCVAGQRYASVQTERDVGQPTHPSTSIVDFDAGITFFATLSDGTMFEPVNALRTHAAKMAKYQRRMSRRIKFSRNWKKAKARITPYHLVASAGCSYPQ